MCKRIAFRIWDPIEERMHYSGSTPSMLQGFFSGTAVLNCMEEMEYQQLLHTKGGVDYYEGDLVKVKGVKPCGEDYNVTMRLGMDGESFKLLEESEELELR